MMPQNMQLNAIDKQMYTVRVQLISLEIAFYFADTLKALSLRRKHFGEY